MPRPSKCTDPNCRSNRPIKESNLCITCKAKKLLGYNPKYKCRNYVFRGIYDDDRLGRFSAGNEPYDISLSYFLSKIPRPYMRILLEIDEREDIEYQLLKRQSHYDTKSLRFGKHRIIWIKLNGTNYLFTPGQIKIPL